MRKGTASPDKSRFPGGQLVRSGGNPDEEMVTVEGQEDEDGKDVLELGNQGNLVSVLGVKDIGGGKTHLVADDCSAKLNSGKDQPRHKTKQQAEDGLVDGEQEEGKRVEADCRQIEREDWKEQQRDGKNQGDLDPGRGLIAEIDRDGADKPCHPGSADEKGLKLINGNKLEIHWSSALL